MSARDFSVDDTLRDGTKVVIRSIRSDDKARIAKAFSALDPESVYTRLFRYKQELTESELARIDAIDFDREVMLVVTKLADDDEIIIGSASYVAGAAGSGPRSAEIAFTVEEDYHGLGIAKRLLHHLIAIAVASNIARFEADVLSGNKAMLAVFQKSGLPIQRRREDGVVHLTLDLTTVK